MTRLTPLLDHNERFARDHTPVPLGLPAARLVLVTCLDHRIDPAALLGLRPGDAPVIRNAGGRVTDTVIHDVSYLAFLAESLLGATGPLFEVAVLHHTQCGTGFLADPAFLHRAARATGVAETVLGASEVADPERTAREDAERLLASPLVPATVSVSAHVHDIETGRVRTVTDARYPRRAAPTGPRPQ
ncbi:carbonic anhydrase [Streptomyces sp. NPDC101225]|uniref:carbonic anhydrase n=1 Tax=Streptomyces sp. NPDC101225 TaxID=3366135 RepID=UPI003814CB5D